MRWTGPRRLDWDGPSHTRLKSPVPPERWPYGPPEAHEDRCAMYKHGLFCDCTASLAEEP